MPDITKTLAPKGKELSSESKTSEGLLPTMANYIKHSEGQAAGLQEEATSSPQVVETLTDNQAAVAQLPTMAPQERSDLGAKNGGMAGAAALNGHPAGALIGATMGSMLYRAEGNIQSGQFQEQQDYQRYKDSFTNFGLAEKSGELYWADGAGFDLTGDHLRVFNSSNASGEFIAPDEFDTTHPLTERTKNQIASPLSSYMLASSLEAGQTTDKNLQKSEALLTNALKTGATSMEDVFRRGQEIVKKIGITKPQFEEYVKSLDIPSKKKAEMRRGLKRLYA